MNKEINIPIGGELLNKVRNEYDEGLNYVDKRRNEFRERLRMYNNQKRDKNLVGMTTMYTMIRTLLAVYYSDSVSVVFKPRRLESAEAMNNLDLLARFDADEMGLAKKNYFVQWDRLFYGVGIRVFEDFDKFTQTPTFRTVSPLCWHPDPYGSPEEGFRFQGFELVVDKDKLRAENGYDVRMIGKMTQTSPSDEVSRNLTAEKDAQGLDSGAMHIMKNDNNITVYHHYTTYKGKKYLITTDEQRDKVLRSVELLPVGKAEKEDFNKIKSPVILNYYSPMRNSPFGTSVSDLTEDKQRMISTLTNLMLKGAKAHLYPMGIYDPRKIKNKRDLDFGFNKNIAARLQPGDSLDSAYKPLIRDTVDNTAFSAKDLLESEARIATGADTMQSGMMGENQRTLGEVQQVQANANVGFLLQSEINAWGDEDFYAYYLREYKANFPKAKKKIVRVTRPDGTNFIELERNDFITAEDPDIEIVSKLKDEKRREKESLEYANYLPLILQDPSLSQAGRNMAKRLLYIKKGYSKQEIDMIIPPTPDEVNARNENEILAYGTPVKIGANDDHQSHHTIHMRSSRNNQVTQQHAAAHMQALIQSGEAKAIRDQEASQDNMSRQENQANMAQSQVGNRLTQMSKSGTNNLT